MGLEKIDVEFIGENHIQVIKMLNDIKEQISHIESKIEDVESKVEELRK